MSMFMLGIMYKLQHTIPSLMSNALRAHG